MVPFPAGPTGKLQRLDRSLFSAIKKRARLFEDPNMQLGESVKSYITDDCAEKLLQIIRSESSLMTSLHILCNYGHPNTEAIRVSGTLANFLLSSGGLQHRPENLPAPPKENVFSHRNLPVTIEWESNIILRKIRCRTKMTCAV